VLLAEDNAINQDLARHLLHGRGHTCVVARNGLEALRCLERERFDLVLMDVQMPELDGLEATRRWRERERATGGHVPIVALTAHAMKGDRDICLAAGMDAYVPKPLNPRQLFSTMNDLVAAAPAEALAAPASPGGAGPDRGLFDEADALDRVDGDRGFLVELVENFRRSHPGVLAELREHARAGRHDELRRDAHTLKGAAASLGAAALAEAARVTEDVAARGAAAETLPSVERIAAEFARVEPSLAAFTKVATTARAPAV
jgi:CheY-like chemotaxis protein